MSRQTWKKGGTKFNPKYARKRKRRDGADGRELTVDLGKKLQYPDIVHTNLHPDVGFSSKKLKTSVTIKLNSLLKVRRFRANERKRLKLADLVADAISWLICPKRAS
ncbi:hypothetical protein DPMN_182333 [Dreissena polymorpha]|uniref:Uncharacterized protein n=1 Tax=Dreissena polymorpha TaxID=45954 RepID=A0A9D4DFL1_DREPO|nr:hypothetical protein DPMN_182333 [Dreissena polymorpha]